MSRLIFGALLVLAAPLAQAGAILGNIDSVKPLSDGSFQVSGWACYTGVSQSISVHVYAGGSAGIGTAIGSAVANRTSEAGVSNACGTTGIPHRFLVVMDADKREVHANKYVYVHGIVPSGQSGSNLTITGSGTLKVPPPLVVTRRYVYGEDLRLCKVIEPETDASITQYDAAGNIAWTASGLDLPDTNDCSRDAGYSSGRRVDRTYDARNRVKSLVFPDGRGNLDYTYGADGKVAAIVAHNDGVGQNVVTTKYEYYRRGLIENEEMSFGTTIKWPIDYTYSRNAGLAQQTYHGLAIDYAPNALGQATKAGAFASNVTYHPGGAIKQFTYGNGIVHSMTQNVRGLPDRSVDSYPGLPDALDDSYTYDGNGNVVAISDGATTGQRGNRTMIYDGLDRLTRVDSPMFATSGTGAATYSYDGVDNLKRVTMSATTGAPARDHCYYYDASQRLTNVIAGDCETGSTVVGLSYDAQGNLSNRDGQNFDFDYGNRLRRVHPNSGPATATYLYDGQGRRIRDYTTASKYSQYSADGQLLQANDLRAGVFSEYVYLGGSLVAIRERTGLPGSYVYATKYQHTDALGSPVAVTDAARVVIERTEYEPFGKVLKPTSPGDGPGYTGHVFDAHTGLNYMQQRYYDPQLGRFLSVDPVAPDPGTAANFNGYKYASNNPYRYIDPDGRQDADKDKKKAPQPARKKRDRRSVLLSDRDVRTHTVWWDNSGEQPTGPHEYYGEEKICSYSLSACTEAQFRSNWGLNFTAPGQTHVAGNGVVNKLPMFGVGGIDIWQVVHEVQFYSPPAGFNAPFMRTANVTLPLHVFTGRIDRYYFARSDGIYVMTIGRGAAYDGPPMNYINNFSGPALFRSVNDQMREAIERASN